MGINIWVAGSLNADSKVSPDLPPYTSQPGPESFGLYFLEPDLPLPAEGISE